MKTKKEKNIQKFNRDVIRTGRYIYTDKNKYSAKVATQRQSYELIKLVKKYFRGRLRIIDVGCGDGTYTKELFSHLKPRKIIAFDSAEEGIRLAKKTLAQGQKGKILYKTMSIYDADKKIKKGEYDLIIVRGVLHHLYNPKRAIKTLSQLSSNILVLEPNGYNPVLKVIEKVSKYHIEHEEKSYYPPQLNSWFEENKLTVREQRFFGMVPYFCPDTFVKVLQKTEFLFGKMPLVNKILCGTNLILYEKK